VAGVPGGGGELLGVAEPVAVGIRQEGARARGVLGVGREPVAIDVVARDRPHDHQGIGHREGAVLGAGERRHVAVHDVLRAGEARVPRHPQPDQAVGGVELAVAAAPGREVAVGEGAQHPGGVRDPRIPAQQELGAVAQAVVVEVASHERG